MPKSFQRNKSKHLFCLLMLIIPLVQFFIFFVLVNYNHVLTAFQKYIVGLDGRGSYVFLEDTFGNFKEVFYDLTHKLELKVSLKNSLIAFAVSLLVGVSFTLIFSSYIYHKRVFSSFFKVMLFLPNIVSTVVFANIFKVIDNVILPTLLGNPLNKSPLLGGDAQTVYATLLCFSMFLGMGVQILSYSGAMSGISESLVEAARLDGVNIVQEFIYITVPMVWPTVVTFLTVSFANFFNQQLSLFTFFDINADPNLTTYGYYMFVQTKSAVSNNARFPYLSAMGLVFTAIIMPIVFTLRWLLKKYGPSTD